MPLRVATDEGDTRFKYLKIQYLNIVASITGNVAINNKIKFCWSGNPKCFVNPLSITVHPSGL